MLIHNFFLVANDYNLIINIVINEFVKKLEMINVTIGE